MRSSARSGSFFCFVILSPLRGFVSQSFYSESSSLGERVENVLDGSLQRMKLEAPFKDINVCSIFGNRNMILCAE